MLDSIIDSIKGEVLESITQKTGLGTEQAEQVLPFAKESLQTGLMEQVKSGNMSGIMDMFNSSGNSLMDNSLFGGIKQNFIQMITSKLNLPGPMAGMVANVGLGKIIESISGKAKSDGEVTQDSLMSTLGLGGGGVADIAKGMLKDKLGSMGKGLFG